MDLLGKTLNDAATRASAGGSERKVAVAEANFTSLQRLYALAQCTPDLTASDCGTCLQFGMGNLVQGKQGGRFLTPSCSVRYEFYPFYNTSALQAPASPPPAPSPPPKGKSNKTTVIIIAVAVPVGVGVVLLFLACCFRQRKATRTYKGIQEGQSGVDDITNAESLQRRGEDLASYAWKNWRDGTPLEVLDPAIGDSYSRNEVLRCLHIGLLCVQEDPMDRPTMANIVLMLSSSSVSLALPQQPAFFLRSRTKGPMKEHESDQSTSSRVVAPHVAFTSFFLGRESARGRAEMSGSARFECLRPVGGAGACRRSVGSELGQAYRGLVGPFRVWFLGWARIE
ncbi:hypothetical protein NL676_007412 [Syzygium grande]|nr:hypothetical protein NL676_007412 [Syzygium grande]